MTFAPEQIENLARLARLKLEPDEKKRLSADLVKIVGYVEQLSEVDTSGVEPMVHAVPARLRRRADHAADEVAGRHALEGSAGYDDHEGMVRVPRIIE